MQNIMNFLLFQIGWFACVLTAAAGQPWLGVIVAFMIIGWHVTQAREPANELRLILIAILIGITWDSFLVWMGWLEYKSGMLVDFLAPYWIVIMWALFATTINYSLSWLKGRWFTAFVFGAIGGPLAYLAGQKLDAVLITHPTAAITALLIGWGVFTPLLLLIASPHLLTQSKSMITKSITE